MRMMGTDCMEKPRLAEKSELLFAHDEDYASRFLHSELKEEEIRRRTASGDEIVERTLA